MKSLSSIFLVLVGFNILLWQGVLDRAIDDPLRVYFLDVGQGDSQLVALPDGAKVLIDGGPSKEILFELGEILDPTERYIDLVIISHAQLDHYGGISDVLDRYQIGALIFNGEEGAGDAWREFKEKAESLGVRVVILGEGDRIEYRDQEFNILSPNTNLLANRDLNEGSLVIELRGEGVKILFTGDIGFAAEKVLIDTHDVDVDVLKVAHHGSRYSTGLQFLEEATPLISVIGVGDNSFGHPTEAVLQRLNQIGSSVYRTDQDGRIELVIENGQIGVIKEETR